MKAILQSIQNRIAASVQAVQYVDENWGQLDLYGPEIPVKWPCVLIDIGSGQFSNIGRNNKMIPTNRQQGNFTVELTIAALKLTNSSFKAPQTQKWHAFDIWELVEEIHREVHGWTPDELSGGLIRSSLNKVKRDDGVQEVRVIYSLGLNDC